jgi:hypothetical protein
MVRLLFLFLRVFFVSLEKCNILFPPWVNPVFYKELYYGNFVIGKNQNKQRLTILKFYIRIINYGLLVCAVMNSYTLLTVLVGAN